MNENEYRNMYEHELNHWWYQGLRQLLAKFMQKAPIKTRDKPLLILDAGCGTGGNTWVLRKHYKIGRAHV